MAKLKALTESPPDFTGGSGRELRELRSYLRRQKEELEFILLRLDEDNLSEALRKKLEGLQEALTGLQEALEGKQDLLTFDAAPAAGSLNPVTSDGVYRAVRARTSAESIFNTLTDVHTDTTITLDEDFTGYKFLAIVLNTRSPAAAAYRMPLLISTNLIAQGGHYPIANSEASGYVRINYVSGDTKKVRFQATDLSSLYVASVLGIT